MLRMPSKKEELDLNILAVFCQKVAEAHDDNSFKYLTKFVGGEIKVALTLGLPIIVVNLNDKRRMDDERCPAFLKTGYIVHIAFSRGIIKHALENFQIEFRGRNRAETGPRLYSEEIYERLRIQRT